MWWLSLLIAKDAMNGARALKVQAVRLSSGQNAPEFKA